MAYGRVKEPVANRPALGVQHSVGVIHEKDRESGNFGIPVVDATTVIATHLTEIIKRHSSDLTWQTQKY